MSQLHLHLHMGNVNSFHIHLTRPWVIFLGDVKCKWIRIYKRIVRFCIFLLVFLSSPSCLGELTTLSSWSSFSLVLKILIWFVCALGMQRIEAPLVIVFYSPCTWYFFSVDWTRIFPYPFCKHANSMINILQ